MEEERLSDKMLEVIDSAYDDFRKAIIMGSLKEGKDPAGVLISTLAACLDFELKQVQELGLMSQEDGNDLRMQMSMTLAQNIFTND